MLGGLSAQSGLQDQVCSLHTLSACLSLKLHSAAKIDNMSRGMDLCLPNQIYLKESEAAAARSVWTEARACMGGFKVCSETYLSLT